MDTIMLPEKDQFVKVFNYYGLPNDYQRTYSKNGIGLKRIVPEDARQRRIANWVQINLPSNDFPLTKASNADIEIVQNITLDFEYPLDPSIPHRIANQWC